MLCGELLFLYSSHTPILSHSQKTRYRTLEGLEGLEAFLSGAEVLPIVRLWEPTTTIP
jgi:hypothetical protein